MPQWDSESQPSTSSVASIRIASCDGKSQERVVLIVALLRVDTTTILVTEQAFL